MEIQLEESTAMGLVDQYKALELFALVYRLKSSRGLLGTDAVDKISDKGGSSILSS